MFHLDPSAGLGKLPRYLQCKSTPDEVLQCWFELGCTRGFFVRGHTELRSRRCMKKAPDKVESEENLFVWEEAASHGRLSGVTLSPSLNTASCCP